MTEHHGISIRPAFAEELVVLPDIERDAAARFAPWGLDVLFASATTPLDVLEESRVRDHLRVAIDRGAVVGFAMMSRVDQHANLDEIDVRVSHGRLGIGRALIQSLTDVALEQGLRRMTLSTMRDVPFNAPWYARLGFRPMLEHELGPGMRTVFARELAGGFPVADRVFMTRDL